MRPTTLTAPSWYTASICSRGGVECAEFEAGSRDWQPPLVLARAWGCLLWTQMPSDICVQTRLAACQRLSLQRDSLLTGTIMGVISKAASLRTASLVVGLSSLRVACAWWSVHQHACINRRPHSWRQEPEATYSPTSGLPRFDSITQWLTQMKTLCASVLLARVCAYSVHCCGALCLSIRCYERLGLRARMYSWAPVCQCACAH